MAVAWIQVNFVLPFAIQFSNANIRQSITFYRATINRRDVWENLTQHWLHFFWLTGETPDTLMHLVNNIDNFMGPFNSFGRKKVLNLKNQVSFEISRQYFCNVPFLKCIQLTCILFLCCRF